MILHILAYMIWMGFSKMMTDKTVELYKIQPLMIVKKEFRWNSTYDNTHDSRIGMQFSL